MTFEECTGILTPLALALRADMDVAVFKAYHRVLKDVPTRLLEMAVDALLNAGTEFMPSAPKLKAECERFRRQWLALNPHTECAECEGQRGFRSVLGRSGQPVVERCPCVGRYQERLEALGMKAPLALLPGEETISNEQHYPTVNELPSGMQSQVRAAIASKVMR